MPSSKEPSVRIVLEPSLYEGASYWCDDNISGHVLLATEGVFYTRSVTVVLEAIQTVQVTAKNSSSGSADQGDAYVHIYPLSRIINFVFYVIRGELSDYRNSKSRKDDKFNIPGFFFLLGIAFSDLL